uniref:Small ribosomal subunit protein uS9c n=1 Tax=Hydropuntia rangiferina TaxID=338881 RepID=A0A345U8J9_9FLOR|nr:ribosomal protein S9 [Hydropuntia rangiferina]AXI96785.1 ribosomal protein S9 [Hydropuntia rangiferina]UAD87466.1 ribosomal protein S9 [Hydropuntia rangiferina]
MTIVKQNSKIIYSGTGRRKTSIARVQLIPGSGNLIINGLPGESYLQFSPNYLRISCAALKLLGLSREYDVYVKAEGGGLTGQTNAIRLGIAKALCKINPDNRTTLKAEGFLRRDARIKERKKYGLRKARKAPQYSKR